MLINNNYTFKAVVKQLKEAHPMTTLYLIYICDVRYGNPAEVFKNYIFYFIDIS